MTSEFARRSIQSTALPVRTSTANAVSNLPAKPRPIPAPKPANIALRTSESPVKISPLQCQVPQRTGLTDVPLPPGRPKLITRTTSPILHDSAVFIPPIPIASKPLTTSEDSSRLAQNAADGFSSASLKSPRLPPQISDVSAAGTAKLAPVPPPARRGGRASDRMPRASAAETDLRSLMPPAAGDPYADIVRYSPFSTPPGSSGGEDDSALKTREDRSRETVATPNTRRAANDARSQEKPRDRRGLGGKLIDVPSQDVIAVQPPPVLPPRREADRTGTNDVFKATSTELELSRLVSSGKKNTLTAPSAPAVLSMTTGNTRTMAPSRNLAVESAKSAFPSRTDGPVSRDKVVSASQLDEGSLVDSSPIQFGSGEPSEYPDFSRSNRRPPRFPYRPWEIDVAYETKLFAAGGKYLCTGGFGVKVWNVLTGELLVSVNHEETVKTTALCVKPSRNLEDHGSTFWLGTNMGDIMELSVHDSYIIRTRSYAHGRADIIKMHTSGRDIWSIDVEGKLLLWPSNELQEADLDQPPISFRVPKPYSASVVVSGRLWHASGREIRVVYPHESQEDKFDVLGKSLSNGNAGDITDAAVGGSNDDRIFFSHTDGKVSIYAADSFTCLGAVTVTQGRLSTITVRLNDLWVGFNSGAIFIYDTSTYPWRIKKDWTAHRDGVSTLLVDDSSIFQADRCQVISLGADLTIKFWDGLLQEDMVDEILLSAEASFSQSRTLTCTVASWNAGACGPEEVVHESQSNPIVDSVFSGKSAPDMIVFGLQELVDLEDTKTTALSFFSSRRKRDHHHPHDHVSRQYSAWREHLMDCLYGKDPDGESYHLLKQDSLVGLFSAVFVRASLRQEISNLQVGQIKRGLGGFHGNKGGTVIRFLINDTSICLVNAHLAAGQKETSHRNTDLTAILEYSGLPPIQPPVSNTALRTSGGDGSMILDHDIVILNGDLNYRIDAMTRDLILRTLGTSNSAASTLSATVSTQFQLPAQTLAKLLSRDQLLLAMRRNPLFRARCLREGNITFAPTYKYDVGTDRYDNSEKRRPPAWCDRILYRGAAIEPDTTATAAANGQHWYQRVEGLRASDHRPVLARFRIRTKKVEDWALWNLARERAERQVRERKVAFWRESLVRVLREGYGVERAVAEGIVVEAKSVRDVSVALQRRAR